MAAKFIVVLCIAAASALPVQVVQPSAPAHYDFSYSVHDTHSGDVKQQQEARNGDAVHGSYSLIQPDGLQRVVEYTADAHNGFNANVRYEGHATAPAKVYSPTQYAAPVAKISYPAPVAYSAPKLAYTAPIQYSAPLSAKVSYASPKATYNQDALAHFTFSSPVVTYHH